MQGERSNEEKLQLEARIKVKIMIEHYCTALSRKAYRQMKSKISPNQLIECFLFFLQELVSQMDEHNSTHTLLSAQMKNLNVSWLLSLVVLAELCTGFVLC